MHNIACIAQIGLKNCIGIFVNRNNENNSPLNEKIQDTINTLLVLLIGSEIEELTPKAYTKQYHFHSFTPFSWFFVIQLSNTDFNRNHLFLILPATHNTIKQPNSSVCRGGSTRNYRFPFVYKPLAQLS